MKKINLLLLCLLAFTMLPAYAAESAASILDRAVAKIKNAGGVECSFKLQGSSAASCGTLSMAGNKFRLSTSKFNTWFDGKNMWTANDDTREITLVNPTSQEIRESNPLEYLKDYKSQYNVYFSKRKDNARHLILLNPKTKGGNIIAVEIAVNKKTLLPERLIIRDRNDVRTTVNISGMTLGSKRNSSWFVCPVKSMGGYELIDLR